MNSENSQWNNSWDGQQQEWSGSQSNPQSTSWSHQQGNWRPEEAHQQAHNWQQGNWEQKQQANYQPFEQNYQYQSQQDPNYQPYWHQPDGSLRISPEERTWAILAHLSALVAGFFSVGCLSFLGPLLIWSLKKDTSPFVRNAAAQSFNFNISILLMNVSAWVMLFTIIFIPVAIILWITAFILLLWHHIMATIATLNNRIYRYPLQFSLLS